MAFEEGVELESIKHDEHELLRRGFGRCNRCVRLEIFNTGQGSPFTREAFTEVLKENGIRISMGGEGNWRDNVFVEMLWRSLKYRGGEFQGV